MLKKAIKSALTRMGVHVERIDRRPESFKVQRRLAGRDAQLIFDVGANVGQTAAEYLKIFPSAQIHSFEPFPESCRQIERNVQSSRVTAHNVAVADKAGTSLLNVCRASHMNSLLAVAPTGPTHMGGLKAEMIGAVEVATITLDDFCEEQRIDSIDILKLDTQGSELLVVNGACRLLRSHAVNVIYTEVNFAQLYDGQASFDDIWRGLEDFGYRLFGLYNLKAGRDFLLGYGDAIFVSPELRITQQMLSSY
jgi:FkbM family methyltransferase